MKGAILPPSRLWENAMFNQDEMSWLRIAAKRTIAIGPSFPIGHENWYDPRAANANMSNYSPVLYSLISSGMIEVVLQQVVSKNPRKFGQTEHQWGGILTPKATIIMAMIESVDV